MAQPITLELSKRDPREELRTRLEQAPIEHAEALLASLEILQGLHDKGALELVQGVVGGSDKILETAVEAANTPEAIRGLRNLIVLIKVLGSVDPEVLGKLAQTLPNTLEAVSKAQQADPPGFWEALKILCSANMRRGLTVLNSMFKGQKP